ncbi:MAG: putative sulfate exporter family transporter [Longispora sp.]|nr:putative sulfate exporter family transporter [Longispora sp. (in: high G+C Gram-positive bacteria)]
MTGAQDTGVARKSTSCAIARLLPGLALALAIAAVATGLGRLAPVIGAPVLAILLGIGIRELLDRTRPVPIKAGAAFAGKYILQAAIVFLGAQLSLANVLKVGVGSLPIMLGSLLACLAMAALLGRWLRIENPLRTLIGVGTGVCGASAIAAATGVLQASRAAVAYAVSTIMVFNVTAVLVFPPIGHLLGMDQESFGLWAGTAINDTSSVVAAAYSYGTEAGDYAVIVKLTRALTIIPIVLGLSYLAARRARGAAEAGAGAGGDAGADASGDSGKKIRPWKLIPAFLPLFLLATVVNSVGLIPASWHGTITTLSTFGIATALAGIGLGTRLGELRSAGWRPLAFGGLLSLTVALSSLGIQIAMGGLR